jgi:hypothetical protein
MKKLILGLSLLSFPVVGYGAGNRILHCRSQSAELVFHTVLFGEVAVGDYTMLNGQRADLPKEGQSADGILVFRNQDRIFEVESAGADGRLQFKLLAQLFGDKPTVIETGVCEEK